MARVFLSHSSKDKPFVRRLAEDLVAMGHEPWLDEWKIKVGECVVTNVERGISDADCVVLVLTPDAVSSGWVEREWKAKYWNEISQRRTFVLPALAKACEIPALLQTRKYADFRKSRRAADPVRVATDALSDTKPALPAERGRVGRRLAPGRRRELRARRAQGGSPPLGPRGRRRRGPVRACGGARPSAAAAHAGPLW